MAITPEQKKQLDIAAGRIKSGTPGSQDVANINYATKRGYISPYNQTPVVETPNLETPRLSSPLKNYQNKVGLINFIKEGIKLKNNYNSDINTSNLYWRQKEADVTSFGDERFKLMSPDEQSNIRLSRANAASAMLKKNAEEAAYREKGIEAITKNTADILEQERQNVQERRQEKSDEFERLKNLQSLGIPATPEDYQAAGIDAIDNRVGGSATWRNMNPGGMKYADWQKKYGAVPGSMSPEKNNYSSFPNIESYRSAAKELLTGRTYGGLTNQEAVNRWITGSKDKIGGYTYDDLVKYGAPAISKPFSMFTPQEWEQFFTAQQKAEGWKEGSTIGEKSSDIVLTPASKAATLVALGMDEQGVRDYLGRVPTESDWITLKANVKKTAIEDSLLALGEDKKNGVKPDKMYNDIISEYGDLLDEKDIESIMYNLGYQKETDYLSGSSTWGPIK